MKENKSVIKIHTIFFASTVFQRMSELGNFLLSFNSPCLAKHVEERTQ